MAEALLTVENLSKSFGDKMLFDDISFGINAGQKTALIARNGYGKSTLLNILTGSTLQDAGKVTFRSNMRMAYLPQNPVIHQQQTVRSFVATTRKAEHEEAWDYEQRVEEILSRLHVDHLLDRPMQELSGGEQKKVALCHILIDNTDLLLLDEPTNHLDIEMIEWLEEFLSRQKLAILMVTHDRYFLDHVCQDILELDNARLYHYRGTYDYYLRKKAEREHNERTEVEKAKQLYRTELEWMRRMPQARGTKAQARIDAFYELEEKAHTQFDDKRPQITVKTERIGGKILEINHISYSGQYAVGSGLYAVGSGQWPVGSGQWSVGSGQWAVCGGQYAAGSNPIIIDDFTYTFKRGEKIGIVGPNGVGKSTFLNIITERLKPSCGRVVVGDTIQFGYYTQQGLRGANDRRVIDLVKDIAEQIDLADGRSMSTHQFLSYFGFDSTTQYNYVGNLSGGERRRLYLMQVLMANPNFLILDEPTNDLDIYTLEILEQFLRGYQGCLVIVSHDRSFMDHIVDHLFIFEGNGRIRDYHSSYSEYRRNVAQQQRTTMLQQREEKPVYKRAHNDKPKATYKEKKEYETLTSEIELLSKEKAELEALLAGGTTDTEAITKASTRIGEVTNLLDEKELRWLELDELM